MDVISNKREISEEASKYVLFILDFLPGDTELTDTFVAKNELLGITCYGPTENMALESARCEAEAILFENLSLIPRVYEEYRKSFFSKKDAQLF